MSTDPGGSTSAPIQRKGHHLRPRHRDPAGRRGAGGSRRGAPGRKRLPGSGANHRRRCNGPLACNSGAMISVYQPDSGQTCNTRIPGRMPKKRSVCLGWRYGSRPRSAAVRWLPARSGIEGAGGRLPSGLRRRRASGHQDAGAEDACQGDRAGGDFERQVHECVILAGRRSKKNPAEAGFVSRA